MKPNELKEKIKQNENIVLIDIREKEEIEASGQKIEGSKNIPMGKMFVEAAKGVLPKDKKIITICKSGKRCEILIKELKPKGYDIDYLEGGIDEWVKKK